MDLIICFCILFIGSLLFWEFSKNLLIEAVENLTHKPTKITKIDYLDIDPCNKSMVIQQKINEAIVALNKAEAINIKYIEDTESDTKQSDKVYVPITELDLSLINKKNELLALQTTLNNLIDNLEPDIEHADISKISSPSKKIYHIITKLNKVITSSNDHIEHIYENIQRGIHEAKTEQQRLANDADLKTKTNEDNNRLLENRYPE